MANNNKLRSALGGNPLTQGIFSKTEIQDRGSSEQKHGIAESSPSPESSERVESTIDNQESTINNQESSFLAKGDRESVNLRLPLDLNDWLNELLKKGKRRHGSKIPKEIWVQAALELFKAMPIDWEKIESEESLHSALLNLESRFNNIDS
jgi:hypothetical protein